MMLPPLQCVMDSPALRTSPCWHGTSEQRDIVTVSAAHIACGGIKIRESSINNLQNGVILLGFKMWKLRIHFVRNLIMRISCEIYYDDVTVTLFINIRYGNIAFESIPQGTAFPYSFLSASLYFSKRGAYWDRLCRDVVGRWLSRACTVAKRCILGL